MRRDRKKGRKEEERKSTKLDVTVRFHSSLSQLPWWESHVRRRWISYTCHVHVHGPVPTLSSPTFCYILKKKKPSPLYYQVFLSLYLELSNYFFIEFPRKIIVIFKTFILIFYELVRVSLTSQTSKRNVFTFVEATSTPDKVYFTSYISPLEE